MLQKIKRHLRITHSMFDLDITDTIEEARAELIRSGVSGGMAMSNDPLIERFIMTYVSSKFSNNPGDAERYEESWKYQEDNIRKSLQYKQEG